MKKIFTIATLLAVGATLSAQQEGTYNESVVVKGSYRPTIEQAEKINFPAQITDTIGRMEHDFRYSITPMRLRALYEPSRIKAARIVGEPATKLYNNYLRLGVGNYWTPMADLYWSSTRDKKKTYGVRLNHLSSWDRLPGYGRNHFGNTGVTLFGKYIVGEKLQLSTDLGYEHDHNLYYGFHDSTLTAVYPTYTRDSISIKDYRASYNVASWNFGVKNMQLDPNKFGFAANVHLSDLWATWGQNEFNLNLSGDVRYGFEMMRQYMGVAYLHMEWDAYTNGLRLGDKMPLGFVLPAVQDTVRIWSNIVKANPYVDFIFSGLQFHAGLTAAWDAYTTDTATLFRLFPDVVVSKKLLADRLALSVGATGGMEANSLNAMRMVNPYIAPGSEMRATRRYDFYGSARWSISRKLEADAEIKYQLLRDDLTFTLDPLYSLNNVYSPLYVDNNRLTIGANITFVNDEMITLRAGGHYYAYGAVDYNDSVVNTALAKLSSPLYRPDWDALVSADVNYHDKWLFHLEGRLLGSMHADAELTLPMRYGIAAEVEYRHNRALSFFLRMDNLAFQRYYLWANYPSQRALFILGLTYTIPHK